MRGRVAARKLSAVLMVAEGAGLERAALLAAARLPADALDDPEAFVPQSAWRDLWREVVQRTGQPGIGLAAAMRLDPGYFGVIDYAVRASVDLQEALGHAERYFRLANTEGRLRIAREGTRVIVERHLRGDEAGYLPPQAAEFAIGAMVTLVRQACARAFALAEVRFRHPACQPHSAYRAFFGCEVRMSQSVDAVAIEEELLSAPMKAPDRRLRELVEAHANHLLGAIETGDSTADEVRSALGRELRLGSASADLVAKRLGMSRRTLHRRLTEEGTSFRAVLDELRKGLARRYLLETPMAAGEIAFLLGYAEASAFHRAFRGWYQATPTAFRRAAAAGSSASRSRA